MQALGYEWKYLVPKKLSEAELEAKRLLKKRGVTFRWHYDL
jgi:hypothetical protein